MAELYFDFRDVFRAARLGLSGKKLWIQFLGLLIGYVGYLILAYVALLASKLSIGTIWATYHLFPVAVIDKFAWYSWVIYIVGIVFWLAVCLLAGNAVARVTYQQLKGDEFYSATDALKFARKNWKSILLSPLSLIGFIAFLIVCGIIVGLLGKIPYVGEFLFAIPVIFYFLVGIFVVFLGVVFLLSLALSPAIVATAEEDTLETVIQNFSTLWNQFWRLVVAEGLLGLIMFVGFYILSWGALYALLIVYRICGLGFLMGDKLNRIAGVAITYFPDRLGDLVVQKASVIFPFLPSKSSFVELFWTPGFFSLPKLQAATGPMNGTELVASVIAGISLFLIVIAVISYPAAIGTVGQALIYIILRKKKDDENLLERKEEEGRPEAEREGVASVEKPAGEEKVEQEGKKD